MADYSRTTLIHILLVAVHVPSLVADAKLQEQHTARALSSESIAGNSVSQKDDDTYHLERRFLLGASSMRLVGGSSPSEGTVEVYSHRGWGTLCDYKFTTNEATVICRTLGYHGPAIAHHNNYFGLVNRVNSLSERVVCTGREADIQQCSSYNITTLYCGGQAGVTCTNGGYPGVWTTWSSWGSCAATCGVGHRTRARTCVFPVPEHKGAACSGDSIQRSNCTLTACPPVDGTWAPWSAYSPCSATCGLGFRFRSRACSFPAGSPHGKPCVGDEFDTSTCGKQQCPVDGKWSAWTLWSSCAKSCGNGLQFRNRFCDYEAGKPHGSTCQGEDTGVQMCTDGPCKVDGVLSKWSSWSQCSHSCNGGNQTRRRVCVFDATAPHGHDCVGALTESQSCATQKCSEWSAWIFTPCSVTCGTGSKHGLRRCSSGHEEDCSGSAYTTQNCTDTPCQVDGGWGDWQTWGTCSHTCGDVSARTRQRSCDRPRPAYGGKGCNGTPWEIVACKVGDCPQWSAWLFTPCSVTCGTGSKQGMRRCSSGREEDCSGSAITTENCTETPCPGGP